MIRADVCIETGVESDNAEPLSRISFPEDMPNGRKGPWPELRVVRQASIDDFEYEPEWNRYLNVIGKENRGKGQARSLGSMAVTLVSAQEIGRVLSIKYPDVYEVRNKTKQLLRRTSKSINANFTTLDNERISDDYTRLQQISDDRLAAAVNAEGPAQEALCVTDPIAQSDIEAELSNDLALLYREGHFTCGEIGIFGKHRLAIDLSNNGELWGERDEVVGVLNRKGFKTALLDQDWAPHIVSFDTFATVGKVALEVPTDIPAEILLERPRAIINNNDPN